MDLDREIGLYLDNAATTFPKPLPVYEAADDFYRRAGGNAGRGGNPLARKASELVESTRARTAAWLEASSPERVIFTASATHALNLAILGIALQAGDVVYVSPFEHNSVLRPVESLRQRLNLSVRQIPFARSSYACDIERLEAAFQTAPPALVCVTQGSNVCGVMPPVAEIARLSKEANPKAVVVVDGAQTAGLYPIDLKSGIIDGLIFSGHKSLYGPYGIAGLVLGSTWRPKPLLFGGTGTISESVHMPNELPSAYEAGSHNVWAAAGLHAALGWLEELGRNEIVQRTMNVAHGLREELTGLPELELFVPAPDVPWCGILSFGHHEVRPQALEAALGAAEIAVRAGLHCAPWAHEWLGTDRKGGTVRVSPSALSSPEDARRFADALTTYA